MTYLAPLLVFLHVVANLVWIGSILSVAVILAHASSTLEPRARGEVARQVYLRLAMPAFAVSFTLGLVRLLTDLGYYFQASHFMHGKLTFALAVIVLHHVLGARAKQMAKGARSSPGTVGALAGGLFVCAVAAAYFAMLKPF